MSDTPRTDAEAGYYDDSGCWKSRSNGECVDTDYARTLERELSAAIARAEAAEAVVENATIEIKRLQAAELKAEAERDTLRAELDWLTTLRAASEHDPDRDGWVRWFFHTDDYWSEVRRDHKQPQYATHWLPLPKPKEAT